MAKAIFKVFFAIIKKVVDIIMTPINLLVASLFPNLAQIMTTFNQAVARVLGGTLGFFSHLLPPVTRTIILLWFSALISYYGILFTAHVILKIIDIIKRVKVW